MEVSAGEREVRCGELGGRGKVRRSGKHEGEGLRKGERSMEIREGGEECEKLGGRERGVCVWGIEGRGER